MKNFSPNSLANLTSAVVTVREVRLGSRRILHKSERSTHMVTCVCVRARARARACVYNEVLLKSVTQHTEALLAAAGQGLRLFYRPAVFFRHFRFTALSFARGKTGRACQKCYSSDFFTSLKFLKSEISQL